MPEVTGIAHAFFSVTDLTRSEPFYDLVLVVTLGCRKGHFSLDDQN